MARIRLRFLSDEATVPVDPPPVLGSTVRHVVYVSDYDGKAKTGATLTVALKYDDGTLHAASELVSVAEIGGGEYRVSFVPTHLGAMYRTRVSLASHIVTLPEFQDIAH